MRRPRLATARAWTIIGLAGLLVGGLAGADGPKWSQAQTGHWAFRTPTRPAVPAVKTVGWVRNPVDAFILAGIEGMGLPPAPEADRVTLIRRLRFDLTGLPPSPEEVAAFVADTRPDAYERLVDRLLETRQYGERQARPWLDLARFAESDGFKSDKTRPAAWRYRDWVVRALNEDMPYDRFLALQLAGDEVAPGDPDAFVATGFNRNYPFEDNNMVPGLNRQLMLDDMTDTTASVVLGLTVACARCHDHKYDPISQADYYRMQALFAAAEPKDEAPLGAPFEQALHSAVRAEFDARVAPLRRRQEAIERPYQAALLKEKLAKLPAEVRKAFETEPVERSAFQEDLLRKYAKEMAVAPAAMEAALKPADRGVWAGLGKEMKAIGDRMPAGPDTGSGLADMGPEAPAVHLLFKGAFGNPREEVGPGFPSVFAGLLPTYTDRATPTNSNRRKALAEWVTRPDHPLTARVLVNRVWQGHFGRGIVATPSDFGTQGTPPSHPELLDWLTTHFTSNGWRVKDLHRLLVTSATYRQASRAPAATVASDPENALFARMPRRRLEGEAVRDALLAVSGDLDLRVGGPSVFPDLPPGVETRGGWTRSPSEADRNRRSLYVFVRRNLKFPLFDAFDFPDTNTTCPERNVTVNAPQALMLLNSEFALGEARSFAGRLLRDPALRSEPGALVTAAYRLAFGRDPAADERDRGLAFLREQAALLAATPRALDLPRPLPGGFPPAAGAALVDYCHALLNLNEFVYVD